MRAQRSENAATPKWRSPRETNSPSAISVLPTSVTGRVTIGAGLARIRDRSGVKSRQNFDDRAVIGYRLRLHITSTMADLGRHSNRTWRSRPRKYNRYRITDWAIEIHEIRPRSPGRFSRPPPSTTRPSLRIEMSPEFARVSGRQRVSPEWHHARHARARHILAIVALMTAIDRRRVARNLTLPISSGLPRSATVSAAMELLYFSCRRQACSD